MTDIKGLSEELKYSPKKINKKIAIILSIFAVIAVFGIVVMAMYVNSRHMFDEWKETAITSPKIGTLQAAGNITINWKAITDSSDVKNYKVYVNDELVAAVDGNIRTYEYYGTTVEGHKAYIEADLKDGTIIYSNIFTFYVNKKGLCMNKDMAKEVDGKKWGASWYYNWDMVEFEYYSFKNLQYVPMMWTRADTDDMVITRFPKRGYKYVLGYNEPDASDQSDIEVEDAVKSFKAFMNKNIKVGSPSTALCPPWSKDWFQPFMKKIQNQGMDVDFIAFHHYWNWYDSNGVKAFLELVDDTYEMYHKPIWITEFAISGDPGKTEEQRKSVEKYMNGVIKGLDERRYVERYAWFSFNPEDDRNGGSSLIQPYTGEITDLGYLYQKIGMPKGYGDKNIKCNVANTKKDIIK